MGETVAIADDSTNDELSGVVGHLKFQIHRRSRREFAGEEQAHAAAAEIGRLAAKAATLTVKEKCDIYDHQYGKPLPAAFVFAGPGDCLVEWF